MKYRWLPALLISAFATVSALGAITISGTIQRTYPSDQCGQLTTCSCSTPTQTAPVRYATVEIRNTSNVRMAITSTTATGTFSVSAGSLSAGAGFRLIVWAETAAAVVYDDPSNALVGIQYSYTTSQSSTNIGTLTIDQNVDAAVPNIRGGLQIMDNAVKAYQYAANRGLSMSQAEIHMNGSGTYYNELTNNIVIQSSETWHDASFHEYGHFMDDLMSPYRGVSGLSNHQICQRFDSNPTGAFGEGWANYVISAVSGRTFFWARYCSVESGPCSEKSRNIEGNVAAVLWDLHDSANESFDTISNAYQKVWDTVEGFQFSNPSLESYMNAYADTRADAIECQYTGQKCDTAKPVISSFGVSPTSISVGSSATISYTVSDSGGSGLSRIELWRAPDSGGAPGTWAQITFRTLSGNGPTTGSFGDAPPQGTFWYGLHALDGAGNLAVEPSPPGPIRVVVGSQSCTYSISPVSRTVSGVAGTGAVQVTGSPAGCSGSWSASSASFVTLTGTASGSGAGTWQVSYSYTQNPSTTASRQGTIGFSGSFPSGGVFTLTQQASAVSATAPALTGAVAPSVGTTTATLGGNVTSDGGSAITARGIVYSRTATNSNPVIGGTGVINATTGGTTGSFTVDVTGLLPATGYSYKAYASNSIGTSYTSASTFTTQATAASAAMLYLVTPCRVLDTRSGTPLSNNTIRTIAIGGKCGVPVGAKAVALNLTAIAPPTAGFAALFPSNQSWPGTTSISYRTAKTRANNSVIAIAPDGTLSLFNSGGVVHFVIDVTAYFQ